MSSRSILHVVVSLAVVMFLTSPQAFAQEFSDEQMEIVEAIEDCNDAFLDEDLDDILDCFHDDFSGWAYGENVPRNKTTAEKYVPLDIEQNEPLQYDFRPISIRVHGDFAIAHYFLLWTYRGADGEVVTENNIWTDILLKEDGDWSWIGDHGGPVSDQP